MNNLHFSGRKGHKWMLSPNSEYQFDEGSYRRRPRGYKVRLIFDLYEVKDQRSTFPLQARKPVDGAPPPQRLSLPKIQHDEAAAAAAAAVDNNNDLQQDQMQQLQQQQAAAAVQPGLYGMVSSLSSFRMCFTACISSTRS